MNTLADTWILGRGLGLSNKTQIFLGQLDFWKRIYV